ncbi:MAG: patatin-like phospholipase family protein [Desulfobacterales bacterium]|nr:patatin-like phospholipase family protein [Desulfobacterales bacterium]
MSHALIIGGGTPKILLMAGALCAFEEKGVKFDVVSASGPSVLPALLYVAPKGKGPREALENMAEVGLEDSLYELLQYNFKIFTEPGPFADMHRQFTDLLTSFVPPFFNNKDLPFYRFQRDFAEMGCRMLSPWRINPDDKGLYKNALFNKDLVDFEKLKNIRTSFYINAYNITDKRMESFSKEEITPEHYQAAVSVPFLHAPYKVNRKYYYEGPAIHALNYKVLEKHPEINTIVLFDMFDVKKMLRVPRHLYDALIMSVIVPRSGLAKRDTEVFELENNMSDKKRKLLKLVFDIPDSYSHNLLDWKYSNLKNLFDIGYESGLKFYNTCKKDLVQGEGI